MNRRTKIIVSVAGIFIVLLALIGLTYAYFLTKINGNTNDKSISVTTDKLELTYQDGNGTITGTNIMPGTTLTNKTFSVKNNGSDTSYIVVLENVTVKDSSNNATTFESNDFVYTLTCTSNCNGTTDEVLPLSGGILVSNDIKKGATQNYTLTITYKETGVDQSNDMGKVLSARVNISTMEKFNPYSDNKQSLAYNIINNAAINKNDTEFKLTPKTSVANAISSSTYGKNVPETYPATKTGITTTNTYTYASDYTIDSSGKFTLVNPQTLVYSSGYETLKGKYIVSTSGSSSTTAATSTSIQTIYKVSPTDVTSTSFKYVKVNNSVSTERELSVAPDDYGTSYYYRGGVKDNYVTLNNMCFRIVRIEGDGSVKLILEDQDESCSSTMDGNWDIPTTTGGTIKTEYFGYTSYAANTLTASDGTKNSGTRYIMNYLNPGTNISSSMSTVFKNFQLSSKISGITNKLKSGNWCMNDKAYASSTDNTTPLTSTEILDKQVKGTVFYYDSYARLQGKTTKEPTLKCNGTKMNKFGDNTTDMYVGTLTADEIIYAGGKVYSNNYAYYLLNDYQRSNSKYWWSLSPASWGGSSDSAFYVDYGGSLYGGNVYYSDRAFRPVVSLATGVEINSGDGTIENPYTIK